MHLLAIARAMGEVSGTEFADPRSSLGSPFSTAIDREQAVAHRGWAEAFNQALSAVLDGRRLVLVVGAPGMGKTLLLQELARTLRAAGADVVLQPRGDLPVDAPEVEMADAGPRRRRVVLIDEADRMNEAALASLGRLGTCAFVLAGMLDPGNDPSGGSSEAVATMVRLTAVPPDEVGTFVAARLAQSGLGTGLLSGEAVTRLAEHSGGIPRALNTLAGAALSLARAERAPRVEAAHVDQAAALRDGDAEIGVAGPAAPIVPGVVPHRQPGTPLPAVVVAPGLPLKAALPLSAPAGSRQVPRRQRIATLSAVVGVIAACAGVVAWHNDHARRTPQLMATATMTTTTMASASPAPPSPGPVAAEPQPGTSAAAPRAVAVAGLEAAAPPVAPSSAVAVAAPLPAARTQPDPEALPSGAPAHVAVRYARGNADASAWAASLALTLRAAGFAVDALMPVAQRDARPGARYFFAEDQGAAQAVLRAVGLPGKGSLSDAAGLNALLRPGLIELTVPPGQVEAGGRSGPPSPGRS